MGHSWAAGLQLSADGKNQESSSEAVNGYRAVALLGTATGDCDACTACTSSSHSSKEQRGSLSQPVTGTAPW